MHAAGNRLFGLDFLADFALERPLKSGSVVLDTCSRHCLDPVKLAELVGVS